MKHRLAAGSSDAGKRLDVVLATAFPELSRSSVQRLVGEERALLNGRKARASQRVAVGDSIEFEIIPRTSLKATAEDIPLPIMYEDEAMAIVEKPAGLVVHPSPGHAGGTIVNALVHRYPHLDGQGGLRPGLVHRLDRDTSGLMVVALSPASQRILAGQIKRRSARREYLALVAGEVAKKRYRVDAPIGRDARSRLKMAVGADTIRPRPARSTFWVEEHAGGFSLVRVALETGRTHQVRVHLAFAGLPVAGDRLYGGPAIEGLSRQFLHAALLELNSPLDGRPMCFESPLPPDLWRVLDDLRRHQPDA